MAFILPLGLGLVACVCLLVVCAEVFYLFYWRKRPLARPRVNNVTVAPVNEGELVERDRAVAIDVTCAEYQISALQQDLVEKLFPSLSTSSTETTHTMMGPPRMLFTIKEETKEELEGLDMDGKGRSRRSSRSKSMSDIPLSGPMSPLTTPFVTPLSSPDVFASTSPYGTPTYSPLVSLPRSLSASPVLLKTSCRIMYDYTKSNSPPPAPPSPTRPTFSFLARARANSRSSPHSLTSTTSGDFVQLSSSKPGSLSPPRRSLFYHLATSPIHKQAECVAKALSPLRTCTYDYESSEPSLSPQSSPDRSPNTYFTPSFGPIQAPSGILVAPSSKGSMFNRRQGSFFSPLSSPSDADTPYASPLLVFPTQSQSEAGPPVSRTSSCEIEEENAAMATALHKHLSPKVSSPLQFSLQGEAPSNSFIPPLATRGGTVY